MDIPISFNPAPTPLPTPKSSRTTPAASSAPATAAPSATAAAVSESSLNLGAFEAMQQAMNSVPDLRSDVVARGKMLAASANWPAAEIINQLAEMFIADAEAAMGTEKK